MEIAGQRRGKVTRACLPPGSVRGHEYSKDALHRVLWIKGLALSYRPGRIPVYLLPCSHHDGHGLQGMQFSRVDIHVRVGLFHDALYLSNHLQITPGVATFFSVPSLIFPCYIVAIVASCLPVILR